MILAMHMQPRWLSQAQQRRGSYVSKYHQCLDKPAFKETVVLDRKEDDGSRRRRQNRVQRERDREEVMSRTAYKHFWKEASKCKSSVALQMLIDQTFNHWYDKDEVNSAERRWMGQALGLLKEKKEAELVRDAAFWQEKRRKELEAEVKAQILKDYGLAS